MTLPPTGQIITPDPPPITDDMTSGSPAAIGIDLIGRTIVTVYEVPTEGDDVLLLLDNGRTIGIGVDIGYNDDAAVSRNPDVHEVFLYDATDTPAGRAMLDLKPGHWLR